MFKYHRTSHHNSCNKIVKSRQHLAFNTTIAVKTCSIFHRHYTMRYSNVPVSILNEENVCQRHNIPLQSVHYFPTLSRHFVSKKSRAGFLSVFLFFFLICGKETNVQPCWCIGSFANETLKGEREFDK